MRIFTNNMFNGEQMKKRFFKTLIVVLMLCCFCLTGCVSMGEATEVDPSIMNTAENADEIMKIKDNITVYKDSNGNNNDGKGADLFGDVLVFVDPGASGKFLDHLDSDKETTFKALAKREIDNLSQWISSALYMFYGGDKNYEVDALEFKEGETTKFNANSTLKLYSSDWDVSENIINAEQYETFLATNDIDVPTGQSLPQVTYKDTSGGAEKKENYFKLRGGIYGGYKLVSKTIEVGEGEDKTEETYYFFADETATSSYIGSEWIVADKLGTGDNNDKITNMSKYISLSIASAVAGVSIPNGYLDMSKQALNSHYEDVLERVDHLGFTDTDIDNSIQAIFDYVIGESVMSEDEEYKPSSPIDDVTNASSSRDIKRYYKGYKLVVSEVFTRLANATHDVDKGGDYSTETTKEQVFFKFPRISIMSVDINYILDNEEIEGTGDEIGDTGYEVPDMDPSEFENMSTTLTEKFAEPVKLVGFLIMPNDLTGDRTMARKENGEWIYTDDTQQEVAKKTFEVDGFLITSAEIALITETGKTAVVEATTKLVNTRVNDEGVTVERAIERKTSQMDVGYEKPEAGDDNFSYSAEYFSDAMALLKSEEKDLITTTTGVTDTLESFRVGGYNGIKLEVNKDTGEGTFYHFDEDNNVWVEVSSANGAKSENGKYVTLTLSTQLHEYISISDINGEVVDESMRTRFPGYKLNLNNFAGNNYLQIDINIISVDDNEEDRDVKLNVLSLKVDGN